MNVQNITIEKLSEKYNDSNPIYNIIQLQVLYNTKDTKTLYLDCESFTTLKNQIDKFEYVDMPNKKVIQKTKDKEVKKPVKTTKPKVSPPKASKTDLAKSPEIKPKKTSKINQKNKKTIKKA